MDRWTDRQTEGQGRTEPFIELLGRSLKITKEKRKITLKPDAIEICHKLGEKNLNKLCP